MDARSNQTDVNNPFKGLFGSEAEHKQSVTQTYLSKIAQKLFGVTIDRGGCGLVVLADLCSPGQQLDAELLGSCLLERLLLADPSQHVSGSPVDSHVLQPEAITFLFESYRRLLAENMTDSLMESTIRKYIIQNTALALQQPVLFNNQDTHSQMVNLFEICCEEEVLVRYVRETCQHILLDEGEEGLSQCFQPVLAHVHTAFKQADIITFSRQHLTLLAIYAAYPPLAKVLVDYIQVDRPHIPLSYADTLFGSILNISCLPKTSEGQYLYFDSQDYTSIKAVERSMWNGLADLGDRLHAIVDALVRDADQRRRVLVWLAGCLDANVPRGKLWSTSNHPLMPVGVGFVSDAFALNLASLCLRLCKPFIDPGKPKDRLLKIDPTYPAASDKVCCIKSFASESCLQPTEENQSRPVASTECNFLTQLFFMTHRAVDLSVRVLLDRAQGLYQDMARLQQLTAGSNTEAITQALKLHMPRFVTMRCALLEPQSLALLSQFEVATCTWLLQVLVTPYQSDSPTFAPIRMRPISFPLPAQSPSTLRCIPEMILESVEVWLRLCKQYSSESLESTELDDVLSTLLVFMSSKHRTRNPHLRAKLAQSLEALLPTQDSRQDERLANPMGTFNRTKLFNQHTHAHQIVECLLNVFVSIEMTGESVEFEQKFNYRRPMYIVMDYLYSIDTHRQSFRRLCREAEASMEQTEPPLFLRFLNLVINDAIFLLDEALSNMAQLRTMVAARESGEWEQLSAEERRRNEQSFQQIGMMARYDNILGKDTIHTLRYLSRDIKSLLCHATMVDRVASMLNYFLYHLVGPNKKNFKVKYQDEYKFEPSTIVKDICKIYISLGGCGEFCKAVSRDARSYSPQLFKYATDVLGRIGAGNLVVDIEEVANRIEQVHSALESEEQLLADCPEEFLDPIMSTIMSDPVYLPTSRITVDRSTIARHLLSDQSDPFNRAPLTMNMVESNTQLKEKIDTWLQERKQSK